MHTHSMVSNHATLERHIPCIHLPPAYPESLAEAIQHVLHFQITPRLRFVFPGSCRAIPAARNPLSRHPHMKKTLPIDEMTGSSQSVRLTSMALLASSTPRDSDGTHEHARAAEQKGAGRNF